MHKLRSLWLGLQASLWFVPAILVVLAIVLAFALIEVQTFVEIDLADAWPWLFGAGAGGARGMLSAIATSMITVAGVVFSITIVALSLASSQYSPRVLRNFMSDRPTQVVLGAFVAIFAYCLIVLRAIRNPDEGAFVPSLAVFGGVLMAFVGVALLIYYIHHVATAIQATSIVARIGDETAGAIDRLFPERLGDGVSADELPPGALPDAWVDVAARTTGYLVGVDGERLLALAAERSTVLCIVPHVGDFVIEGRPLVRVAGRVAPDDSVLQTLHACCTLQRERNVHQDAPYGLQQLVDVALKALSPGIHDPTTAITCIDQLGALLVRIADRRIPSRWRMKDGALRVVADGPGFGDMVALAFASITRHADNHVEILERVVEMLAHVGASTGDAARRAVLTVQLDAVLRRLAQADVAPGHRRALQHRTLALRRTLLGAPA